MKKGMFCRSFYVRKDGSMYVQCGHDRICDTYSNTMGQSVAIPLAGERVLTGLHCDTKKCGIVLIDWSID